MCAFLISCSSVLGLNCELVQETKTRDATNRVRRERERKRECRLRYRERERCREDRRRPVEHTEMSFSSCINIALSVYRGKHSTAFCVRVKKTTPPHSFLTSATGCRLHFVKAAWANTKMLRCLLTLPSLWLAHCLTSNTPRSCPLSAGCWQEAESVRPYLWSPDAAVCRAPDTFFTRLCKRKRKKVRKILEGKRETKEGIARHKCVRDHQGKSTVIRW